MKHEETGVISSAAVVSAASENPDDAEFREPEIFSQLLLFVVSIFILHYILYTYVPLYGDSDRIHLVPDFDLQEEINRNSEYRYRYLTDRHVYLVALRQFLLNFMRCDDV